MRNPSDVRSPDDWLQSRLRNDHASGLLFHVFEFDDDVRFADFLAHAPHELFEEVLGSHAGLGEQVLVAFGNLTGLYGPPFGRLVVVQQMSGI